MIERGYLGVRDICDGGTVIGGRYQREHNRGTITEGRKKENFSSCSVQ